MPTHLASRQISPPPHQQRASPIDDWQLQSRSELALGFGKLSSEEYRGRDGRYHSKRPPADEQLLAPFRRATLAGIDSENLFGKL
jgi:hypothetical protein